MYTPPFNIMPEIINLIADISAQIERYTIRMEQADKLRLRKANRVKTIHSSLAIEGNTLSESQVSDIIDGKHIVAPIKQIQEVKNAIAAYELYPKLNPFDIKHLLKAHGVMMSALVDNAGRFRRSGVGVFDSQKCVHLAPPADRVPTLMSELYEWLNKAKDHLLIRSCVFHYEFEFIHPFEDGNGRMGRLWQSLILGRLNPIFEPLPVENMVYANQQVYYNAISTATVDEVFVQKLAVILKTLKEHQGEPLSKDDVELSDVDKEFVEKFGEEYGIKYGKEYGISDKKILLLLCSEPTLSARKIAERIGMSLRGVEKQIKKLKSLGVLSREGGRKKGFWSVNLSSPNA